MTPSERAAVTSFAQWYISTGSLIWGAKICSRPHKNLAAVMVDTYVDEMGERPMPETPTPNPPQRCRKCDAEFNSFIEGEQHIKAGLCAGCLRDEDARQRARMEHETGKFRVTTDKQQSLF